ncbi:hypothetical protein [Streptomyces halstedii]
MRVLMGRLSAEKASLSNTSGLFFQNDLGTGSELRGVRSSLDEL